MDAIEADGVHIGQDDAPVDAARALVGHGRLIGLSTHTPAQVDASNDADVDYIGVGPVHATPTKPGRPAVGLTLVRYAARHAEHPFFAIGGVQLANANEVARAGGARIAVVRALTQVQEPEAMARALRRALDVPQRARPALAQRSRKRGRHGPPTGAPAEARPPQAPAPEPGVADARTAHGYCRVARRRHRAGPHEHP